MDHLSCQLYCVGMAGKLEASKSKEKGEMTRGRTQKVMECFRHLGPYGSGRQLRSVSQDIIPWSYGALGNP